MTLAGRLSAFFPGALAAVLVTASAAAYGLAYVYLHRQLDERLERALDTLEAAVDVEPDGLESEPDDRRITLGTDPGPDQVRWSIGDPPGRPVDRSANATAGVFPPLGAPDVAPARARGDATTSADAPGWRLAGRRLRLGELIRAGRGHPEDPGRGSRVTLSLPATGCARGTPGVVPRADRGGFADSAGVGHSVASPAGEEP